MRATLQRLMVALTLSLGTISAPALAKTPDTLVLAPDATTAMVVIKTDWWEPAPSMKSAFKLALAAYDPAQEKLLGGPFGGGALFEAREKNFADGYLILPIKPGRWVFLSYAQQDKWALCFNATSRQFDVKPGEVVFLGEFDALHHRQELTRQAVMSGKISISGYGFADFFDLPEGPQLRPIDDVQLAGVREMLARKAPGVTAPVRAADYSAARFGTGSTLFAERRCGGYFAVGAKHKDPKPAP